jgi:hypothetical protein
VAVAVARITWNNTPKWIKVGLTGGTDEDGEINDELASPVAVWNKVTEVLNLASELIEDVRYADVRYSDVPQYKMMACFLCISYSMAQIDNDPEFRESFFSKDGVDVTEQELNILTKYLDLAEWAYLESQIDVEKLLRPLHYKLLRFDNATEPGRVGHYIAVHHEQKQVIVAIKGTSTLSDVFTDLIGRAVPHTTEGEEIRFHEGMYTAARFLFEETFHLVEKFFVPQGYKLYICGHSLGAGVSCLLGMLMKKRLPSLDLQVYAFATPVCCSYEASLECQTYITSVVNNTDCVPRLSLMNLRALYKLMNFVDSKLQEKGMGPDNFASAIRYLNELATSDSKYLLKPHELNQFLSDLNSAPREDRFLDLELYVPGRVVSLWTHVNDSNIIGGKVTDGQSQVLKQIIVESTMVADHSCDSYRANLLHLTEQVANLI